MPFVLKTSEATGKCAIYEVASLTAPVTTGPLTTPASHTADLHFHSDWYYPRIIGADYTGSGTVPSGAAGAFQNGIITLFAHGQSAAPMVFGTITIGGTTLTLSGDVCIERGTYSWTWLSLEVDATNVYLRYYGAIRFGSGGAASQAFTYVVKVTDWLTTGSIPAGSGSDPVFAASASGGYVTMGRGKFDSRRRYFKLTGSGAVTQIVSGDTMQMIQQVDTSNGIQSQGGIIWGYALAGYERPTIYATDITINPTYTNAYA